MSDIVYESPDKDGFSTLYGTVDGVDFQQLDILINCNTLFYVTS